MSDHTILVILVVKTFFIQFFCVLLPILKICFCQVHTVSVHYCNISYIYMYIYHNFFIHTSVKGVLVCFHVLAIESNAAVNVREHTSFRIIVFSRNMLRSEVAGSYGNSIFSF